jgi:hypothetical protein
MRCILDSLGRQKRDKYKLSTDRSELWLDFIFQVSIAQLHRVRVHIRAGISNP